MTADEFRAEIAASPMQCSRCGLVACTCWSSGGHGIVMAPAGKAHIVAMKIAYRDWEPPPELLASLRGALEDASHEDRRRARIARTRGLLK